MLVFQALVLRQGDGRWCARRERHWWRRRWVRRLSQRHVLAGEEPLESLSHVAQEMKPVGDLPSLRRSLTRPIGIGATAITANHLHSGMTTQPVGECSCGAIG
jgi:hypothetical protein